MFKLNECLIKLELLSDWAHIHALVIHMCILIHFFTLLSALIPSSRERYPTLNSYVYASPRGGRGAPW